VCQTLVPLEDRLSVTGGHVLIVGVALGALFEHQCLEVALRRFQCVDIAMTVLALEVFLEVVKIVSELSGNSAMAASAGDENGLFRPGHVPRKVFDGVTARAAV